MRVDRKRVRAAVETNAPDLLRYFLRRVPVAEDAADLLGDTLLVLWGRAGDLPSTPEEARMWMFGIARNVLHTHRRQTAGRERLRARLMDDALHGEPAAADVIGRRMEIDGALAVLDPSKKELVLLVHGEGFTIAQAAQILGLNASTARSRYASALGEMRLALRVNDSGGANSRTAVSRQVSP
jgi:RNA polymerase sigma-70 factor (ECF subfamily)